MGRRGPPPTPTALRVLNGDSPYRINSREPKPLLGSPKPPWWMGKAARRHYRDAVHELEPMRVLSLADRDALAMYALALAEFCAAQASIEEHGLLVSSNRGLKRNPAIMIANQAFARWYRLALQFGLTPAARVSLTAGPEPDAAGAKALLSW